MHNHLPRVDPTRSLSGGHRPPESEQAALRRLHREHVHAERERGGEGLAPPLTRRIFRRPTSAILALVGMRR
jgi:hypothetical protein